MSAPEFHTLTVSEIEPLTDDAVAITFAVPDEVSEQFRYLPGQHVTVRAFIDGEDAGAAFGFSHRVPRVPFPFFRGERFCWCGPSSARP